MAIDLFTTDFANKPYWWDAAPPTPTPHLDLPKSTDVVIIGSGVTGLSAALTLARDGRSVLVLDSEDPGSGASRRNVGLLNRKPKASFAELEKLGGPALADRVYREQYEALQSTIRLIRDERIACHLDICGRYVAATSPGAYRALEKDLEISKRRLGWDYEMVPPARQHTQTGSNRYFGGVILPDLGSLHPGLYHLGLLERAIKAGALIQGRTPALSFKREDGTGKVVTDRGTITAREIIVATNGYTPKRFGWFARRLIPFNGYVAATEVLPESVLDKVLPAKRPVLESRFDQNVLRRAPDSARLIVCGRTGSTMKSAEDIAAAMREIVTYMQPELAGVRFYRAWSGQCAGTFDMRAHIGKTADGIRYAMGYNFGGLLIGTYFGRKLAQQILGSAEGETVFEQLKFPVMPLYDGTPWFVPLAMKYFNWKDRKFDRASLREAA